MRIGGVASEDNTTDILTKNLQPHLHQKHCTHLHIHAHKTKRGKRGTTLTNNSIRLTSLFQGLSHQVVEAKPEDRELSLVEKHLPYQLPRIRIRKSPLAHIQETPGQRVDLTDRTRRRQQAKTLTRKLVKLLKVAHIPLKTHVRHDRKTTKRGH